MAELRNIEFFNFSEGKDIILKFDNGFEVSTYLSANKAKDPKNVAERLENLARKIRLCDQAGRI